MSGPDDPGTRPATPDGRVRCAWAEGSELYRRYHDEEWGRPVHGEQALYERLVLEAFQSGLAWITVLRKRPALRAAFAGFDPDTVARYTAADEERLLADPGIIRNRAKVHAAVVNARAVIGLRADGGLDRLVWSHAPAPGPRPATLGDVPATTAESAALARDLKRRGFSFVGPTTAYAMMQAVGMVDDHVAGCWLAGGPVPDHRA